MGLVLRPGVAHLSKNSPLPMRALKTVAIILLALLTLLLLLGLTGPDRYRYERSVFIDAPPSAVYGHVSTLAAMDRWSPWNELDPQMRKRIEGQDGTVGAVSFWEGNEDVGKGEQRIDSLVTDQLVRTHLRFIEPWASESDAFVELQPEGTGTQVTWAIAGKNDLLGRLMSKFVDMDAMMGKDFEKGLAMLKGQVEEADALRKADLAERTVGGYLMERIDRPEMVYVGKRGKKVKWEVLEAFLNDHLMGVEAALREAGIAVSGPASAIYWAWNETDRTADVMAAMPVTGDASVVVEGYETVVVPAGAMVRTSHRGDPMNNMAAHEAMDTFIRNKGLTHYGNVIEVFETGAEQTPDTSAWTTDILYMVK